MDWDTAFALIGFAMATAFTPGPNNVMLAASGATFGWRATVPHAAGISLGFPVMLFLIALGLGEVFQRSSILREGLAWIGFAAMLYLSWRIATAGPPDQNPRARPLSFLEASAFQWVNPKAWTIAIGVAATYATGTRPLTEAAICAGAFVLAAVPSTQAWALFGVGIGRILGRGWRLRAFNLAMGALLAVSALWLVLHT